MFTVLFLLVVVGAMQNPEQARTSVSGTLDQILSKPLDMTGEYKNPPQPVNVITGSFNPSGPGNVVYKDEANENRKNHYKAIRSDLLKSPDLQPVLKLEVVRDNMKVWSDTKWSWIDYDQGILYFYFGSEENGIISPADNYTGNYQLIINIQ